MRNIAAHSNSVRLAALAVAALTAWRLAILAFDAPNLSFDEAQYWAWAQNFQLGYFSKPPMVAWAIAATTLVCGEGEGCVKLSAALAHLATAGLLFLLARDLFNARVAAWTAVSWLTMPAVSLSSMMITTDPFLLTCWAGALWCLVRARNGHALSWWLGFGLFLGLGLLSKYAMAFFLGSLAVWLVWDREARGMLRRPGLWIGIALGLAIYAPNLVWNALNGFVSYEHTKENANLGGGLFHPAKLAEFVAGQFAVAGPILMAGVLAGLFVGLRRPERSHARLLVSFALPVLLVMTTESLLSRANANWTAPAYVAGLLLAVAWLDARRPAWLMVSLALHVIAAFGLYHFDVLRPLLGDHAVRLDPLRRVVGWDLVGERVSAILAQHPGARLLGDERKVLASLTYYVQPHPFDAVKWNPRGQVRDHFDQISRLEAGEKALIYVTEHPDLPQDIMARFESARHLATVRDHVDAGGRGRPLMVWLLTGFKGY